MRENRMHGSMWRREATPDQSAQPCGPRTPPADPTFRASAVGSGVPAGSGAVSATLAAPRREASTRSEGPPREPEAGLRRASGIACGVFVERARGDVAGTAPGDRSGGSSRWESSRWESRRPARPPPGRSGAPGLGRSCSGGDTRSDATRTCAPAGGEDPRGWCRGVGEATAWSPRCPNRAGRSGTAAPSTAWSGVHGLARVRAAGTECTTDTNIEQNLDKDGVESLDSS